MPHPLLLDQHALTDCTPLHPAMESESLRAKCMDTILELARVESIPLLPIPHSLKSQLQRHHYCM